MSPEELLSLMSEAKRQFPHDPDKPFMMVGTNDGTIFHHPKLPGGELPYAQVETALRALIARQLVRPVGMNAYVLS